MGPCSNDHFQLHDPLLRRHISHHTNTLASDVGPPPHAARITSSMDATPSTYPICPASRPEKLVATAHRSPPQSVRTSSNPPDATKSLHCRPFDQSGR